MSCPCNKSHVNKTSPFNQNLGFSINHRTTQKPPTQQHCCRLPQKLLKTKPYPSTNPNHTHDIANCRHTLSIQICCHSTKNDKIHMSETYLLYRGIKPLVPTGFTLLRGFPHQQGWYSSPLILSILHHGCLEYLILRVFPHASLYHDPHLGLLSVTPSLTGCLEGNRTLINKNHPNPYSHSKTHAKNAVGHLSDITKTPWKTFSKSFEVLEGVKFVCKC